jgi:hypothetical protein
MITFCGEFWKIMGVPPLPPKIGQVDDNKELSGKLSKA